MSDKLFFETQPLSRVFKINTLSVMPNTQPKDQWHHHSIPAFDEIGGSVLEYGEDIESNKTQIINPSVLVSKLNPRKSRVSLVLPKGQENHCCSTEFICYEPIDKTTVLSFWKHFFGSNYFRAKLTKIAIGSTNSHTRAAPKETLNWDVPIVTQLESQKIAEILDTLDTQIRETEAIIAKLQQVKQGLLHDLLTRGVDENGELRPSYEDAPELYKPSKLGWIPIEWRVVELDKLLKQIDSGWSPNCPEIKPADGEWGVLKVSSVTGGVFRDFESKVLPPSLQPRPELEVMPEDVVLTRANGNPNLVARAVLVEKTQEKLMLSDKLLRLVPNQHVSPRILVELMGLMTTRSQVLTYSSGSSGQKNISQQQLREILVVKVPVLEQLEIEKRLNSCDNRIRDEVSLLSKLATKKIGLMDDLLTGKVRVIELLKQKQAS